VPSAASPRAVLVTGASSGIGAATARLLACRATTVGIVGRRAEHLQSVLEECRAHAPDSRMWVADLADLEGAERMLDEAWDSLGGLAALVNNAAVPKVRPATSLTAAEVEQVMRVNFFSPARLTLRVLPRMLEHGGGAIVNVASMGGRIGIAHEAAYCASKFALCGFTESLAIDLHATPVKVRLVQPGPIDTDIWDRPGEMRAVYDGPKEPPEGVAEAIVAAIDGDGFERYVPDLSAVVAYKNSDIDGYIAAAASLIEAKGAR
jgi:short-subunit dehydrogenase